MKLFVCQVCSNLLYFENYTCEACGSQVGYIPELESLSVVEPQSTAWKAAADPDQAYRFCANWEQRGCNWLIKSGISDFCRACQHNATIPHITDPVQHALWVKMEDAKRRLFYSLIKLRLPLPRPGMGEPTPLEFSFVSATPGRKASTGHDRGTITISLIEADDAEREKMRANMHEPYRTLLGHFRHEVGHFYWDRLVSQNNGVKLEEFREMFGDERVHYRGALQRYYDNGPKPNWQESHVSAYATMHPWEDFAETWAHFLHIVDTLEMAFAFGMSVNPRAAVAENLRATIYRNPYLATSIEELLSAWLPMTFAINSLNRTMGQADLYPFVISPPAAAKIDFVRRLVNGK